MSVTTPQESRFPAMFAASDCISSHTFVFLISEIQKSLDFVLSPLMSVSYVFTSQLHDMTSLCSRDLFYSVNVFTAFHFIQQTSIHLKRAHNKLLCTFWKHLLNICCLQKEFSIWYVIKTKKWKELYRDDGWFIPLYRVFEILQGLIQVNASCSELQGSCKYSSESYA